MTDTDIQIKINAVATDASREIKSLTKQIDSMNKTIAKGGKVNQYAVGQMTRSFKSLTAHVSKLALIYGTFKTLLTGTVITAQFEQSIKKLGIYSGATADQLKELEGKAKELGESTVFSASQVAEGMNEMALAGLSADDMMAGIGDTLNLASVGMITLKEATDYTVTSMKTYGLNATDMNNITDIFAKGATISATNVTQLGQALTKVGAVAKSYEVSLEETVALLGALADGGRRGAEAGTQLKIAMLRLASNPEAKKYLDKLKISMYELQVQADGTTKQVLLPFTEQLRIVRDRLKELNAEARNEAMARIFGTEAVASAEILMGNLEGVHKKLADIRDAMENDFARTSAIAMVDTLIGSFKNLMSALEGLAIKIMSELTPALREMLDNWTETIRGMNEDDVKEFSESLIALIKTVTLVSDVIGTLAGALVGFTKVVAPVIGVLGLFIVQTKVLNSLLLTFAVTTTEAGVATSRFSKLLAIAKIHMISFLNVMKMHPVILALSALVTATYMYIGALDDQAEKEREVADAMQHRADKQIALGNIIEEGLDEENGKLRSNNEERYKLIQTISTYLAKLIEETKQLKRGNRTFEQYQEYIKGVKEEKERLFATLKKLGAEIDNETGAIKKATDAQISHSIATAEAIENYDKYIKALDKGIRKVEKALYKEEKALNKLKLAHSKLRKDMIDAEKKYADAISQIDEDYEKLEYDSKTKNLSEYRKYLFDKLRATELAKKAEKAFDEGRIEEAERYYSEAKSLAQGFSAVEIKEKDKVLAHEEETRKEALKILRITQAGEKKILAEKRIAEKEAHVAKLEFMKFEMDAMIHQIEIQGLMLQALKEFKKEAKTNVPSFGEDKHMQDKLKELKDLRDGMGDHILELKVKLDKDKFDIEKQKVEEGINKLNNSHISPKVNTKSIEEATEKTYHLESHLETNLNGKEVTVMVMVEDENINNADIAIDELSEKANTPIMTIIDVESSSLDELNKDVDTLLKKTEYVTMNVHTDDEEVDDTTEKVKKLETAVKKIKPEIKIKTNIKEATKEIDKIEPHAKSKKPLTQELVTDVLPAKLAIDQFVGWVGTVEASLKVYANVTPATQGVNKLISWINKQVAYVHVYEVYHSARAGGGLIPQRLADGGVFTGSGRVAGYDPTDSDKVSARLTGGEFVVKRQAVDSYGLSILHAINTMSYPKPRGYAMGGVVGGNNTVSSPEMANITLNIGNQSFSVLGDRANAESLVRFIESEGGL